ncbi:hypothetical protein Taro_033227 [Colocasia esculenta]|uniref:Fanconi Anaemia group E protein C-terminal domain-containing protein n=1 Tax=Colocasia esculenta TaxID=4460 RepID=A0A843VTC1_COLES|nr:hypothetical protein [Colocasia esculenta]
MEQWVPLYEIFLHSPSPDGEASLWFQEQQQSPSVTSGFLSLLEAPATVLSRPIPTSPPTLRRCMWIQTLPAAVQSRILSFLAVESHRFCHRRLHSLAARFLEAAGRDGVGCTGEYFWAFAAAQHLFDVVSLRNPDVIPASTGKEMREDKGRLGKDEEFDSIPGWLSSIAATQRPLLPWLPLSSDQVRELGQGSFAEAEEKDDIEKEPLYENTTGEEAVAQSELPKSDSERLSPHLCDKASNLKSEILAAVSASDAMRIANDIQGLCFEHGGRAKNTLQVLSLVEPWELEDEMASVLLAQLSGSGSLGNPDWHSHLLCSIVLPKLLVLESPASRALLSATIDFCKQHQVAAVNALLLPLVLRREGINTALRDVLGRIIKECLHQAHVSACCQKLLRGVRLKEELICLPCHEIQISDHLVWTESLFSLFQHILNTGVQLTPDSIDHLVTSIDGMAGEFAKSLKFCNFLLCLVTKCPYVLKCHKLSLLRVVERTDTFVTRSILSKLTNQ